MEVLTAGLAVVVLYLFGSLRIIRQYERAVTFFLGRFWGTKGPGLIFIPAILAHAKRISLRIVALDITPQDVITRDNVSLKVNAVLYREKINGILKRIIDERTDAWGIAVSAVEVKDLDLPSAMTSWGLGVIRDAFRSLQTCAVGTAVEGAVRFDAVANDPATAMGANRSQLLDSAFEAVEDVPVPSGNDLERQVVVVAADLADPHSASSEGVAASHRLS
jgi:hypothetical protein